MRYVRQLAHREVNPVRQLAHREVNLILSIDLRRLRLKPGLYMTLRLPRRHGQQVYLCFNQRKFLVGRPQPCMSSVSYVICCRRADDVRLFKYIIYIPYAVAALLSY